MEVRIVREMNDASGYWASFEGDDSILKLTVVAAMSRQHKGGSLLMWSLNIMLMKLLIKTLHKVFVNAF